jgi:hypothetical protein
MIQIDIKDFIGYSYQPLKGNSKIVDSSVCNLSFIKDEQEYDVKALISVEYNRWYSPETPDLPKEDEYDVKFFDIELIKGTGEKDLSEKDLRRLREFIIENIEFI